MTHPADLSAMDQALRALLGADPGSELTLRAAKERQQAAEQEAAKRREAAARRLRDLEGHLQTPAGAAIAAFVREEVALIRAQERGLLARSNVNEIALASAFTQGVEHVADLLTRKENA